MGRFDSELWALKDEKYQKFNGKLLPNVEEQRIIGIRTPILRDLTKRLLKERPEECALFLEELPHFYLEENHLHGFLIERMKNVEEALEATEKFLPYIDNWETCDLFSPKIYKKNPQKVLPRIQNWLKSKDEYAVRYAVGLLLSDFLDEQFEPEYMDWILSVKREEYYIKMMIAWYFSTALVKQYAWALPVISEHRLDVWTHNKSIQKAVESRRISDEQKAYLKTLKRK